MVTATHVIHMKCHKVGIIMTALVVMRTLRFRETPS